MASVVLSICFGSVLAWLYIVDITLPTSVTIPLFTLYAAIFLLRPPIKSAAASFIPRMTLLLYVMPFLHLWGYLFFDSFVFFPTYLLSYGYQHDLRIIRSLATVGLIGTIGLVCGFQISHLRRNSLLQPRKIPRGGDDHSALGFGSPILIAMLALLFAWIQAPAQSILSSRYVDIWSQRRGQAIGFAGGSIVCYSLIALLALDALKEDRRALRLYKFTLFGVTFLTVLIVFQILQGNRDIFGLILALLSLNLIGAARGRTQRNIPLSTISPRAGRTSPIAHSARGVRRRLLLAGVCLGFTFAGFQILGEWRGSASSGYSPSQAMSAVIVRGAFLEGTWTATLMTPLSTVGDLQNQTKTLRFGRTYLDLLLSLPPGPVAALFGYVRPFEPTQGLAHEMTFGLGGTHLTVTPLLNFSAPGVLIVLSLIGLVLGNIEQRASRGSSWQVFLSCVCIIALPTYIWYGDMYIIRAVMCAYGVWFGYRILLFAESHRVRPRFLPGSGLAVH